MIIHRLGQGNIVGAIQWNDDVWNIGAKDNLRGLRIKPPVEFRFPLEGVACHVDLSRHRDDLFDQGNDGGIFPDRQSQVCRRRHLQNGNFVGVPMNHPDNEIDGIFFCWPRVSGEAVGRRDQIFWTRLRTRIGAYILGP